MSVNTNMGATSGSSTVNTSGAIANVGGTQGGVEVGAVAYDGMGSKPALKTGGHVFSLEDVLLRDQLIGTGVISTVNSYETILFNMNVWSLLLNTAQTEYFLNNYQGIRGDLVVTVICNLPSGCYGSYALTALPEAYAPMNGSTVYRTDTLDYAFTARHGIHALFDCANSNTVQLELPFVWPEEFLKVHGSLSIFNEMWRIRMQALQPLRNIANEAFSAGVTVYARLKPGYQLVNPVYQSGKPSSYAKAAATGLNLGADFLDSIGYTKDAQCDPPAPNVIRYFTNPSTIDGLDTSESTSLRSAPYVSSDSAIGGFSSDDCADFASLFSHWTLVGRLPWTVGNLINDSLGSIPVTPCLCESITNDSAIGVLALRTTPAGYVALPFEHWRGGMEYQILVPVSAFHRGALQIFWDEEPNATFPVDPTGRSLNVIMDVALGKTQEISVDYASHWPCLDNVFTTRQRALYVGTNADSIGANPSFANGYLNFRVVTRLVCSTNAGSAADTNILVFARAKPDMRFGVPRHTLGLVFEDVPIDDTRSIREAIRFQSGTVGDYTPAVKNTNLVITSSDPDLASVVLWGDSFSSVRGLMQRVSLLAYTSVWGSLPATNVGPVFARRTGATGESASNYTCIPFMPPPPLTAAVAGTVFGAIYQNLVNQNWSESIDFARRSTFTWYSYYAMLFSGVRSSLRVKVNRVYGPEGSLLSTQGMTVNEPFVYEVFFNNSLALQSQDQHDMQPQPLTQFTGAEIVTPYGEVQFFRNPQVIRDIVDANSLNHVTKIMSTVGSGLTATVAQVAVDKVSVGAGPDVTPICFRRVPVVYIPYTA